MSQNMWFDAERFFTHSNEHLNLVIHHTSCASDDKVLRVTKKKY